MAYLYHQPLPRFQSLVPTAKQISTISFALNVNTRTLYMVLNGSTIPIKHLLQDVELISKSLVPKLHQLLHASVPAYTSTTYPSISNGRLALKNYLKCCCYLHHTSTSKLVQVMGYSLTQYRWLLGHKNEHDIINGLNQLPFTSLKVNLTTIKNVLKRQNQPFIDLINKVSEQVKDRKSLKRFIYAVAYLYGTSVPAISRTLGYSSTYIASAIHSGTGEKVTNTLNAVANHLSIPNHSFHTAIINANLHSGTHAYLNRMAFVTKYIHAPIKYYESNHQHNKDQKLTGKALHNIHRIINNKHINHKELDNNIWQILLSWAHMFGFSAKNFVKDNLTNFQTKDITQIKQDKHSYMIKEPKDWLVILKKIHHQLDFVKYSFNLKKVQESRYANYIYVGKINVGNPLIETANRKLAKHDGKRLIFTAHFKKTGIKTINNNKFNKTKDFYMPTLELVNIKHHGTIVANNIWFNYTKGFTKLGVMHAGDLLQFSARVYKFYNGKYGKNSIKLADYGLRYPSGMKLIRRIHARDSEPVPSDRATLTGYAISNNKSASYDFSYGNYGYVRYCLNCYKDWKRKAEQHD